MDKKNKYYWIKLKNTFLTSDAVDFLMAQKNGSKYVILYQMLCLKTINTGGLLAREIGDVLIKYDIDKIQRDTKYFDIDTIMVALELFQKLGLVAQEKNGLLQITNFENMVGYETKWAEYKRIQRDKEKVLLEDKKLLDIVQQMSSKSIDLRVKSKEKDKDKEKDKEKDLSIEMAELNKLKALRKEKKTK